MDTTRCLMLSWLLAEIISISPPAPCQLTGVQGGKWRDLERLNNLVLPSKIHPVVFPWILLLPKYLGAD